MSLDLDLFRLKIGLDLEKFQKILDLALQDLEISQYREKLEKNLEIFWLSELSNFLKFQNLEHF